MNSLDFRKLNKYQKGIIISLLILSVSMLGFIFNTNVRLGKLTDDIYNIVIEESIDIDPEDTEPKLTISYDDAYGLLIMLTFPLVLYKISKMIWDLRY